jgi:hypothetical protein
MAQHTDRRDGTGIEIGPGVVVVDLAAVDLSTLTPQAFREAFSEAAAQQQDDELDVEDVLGDLDLSPL